MGRRTKLTPELQASICKMIRGGVYPEAACRIEGISPSTYYDWRSRGAKGEEPFESFLLETDRAEAEINSRVEVEIFRAVKRDWRAGAYLLSKRMPHVYGDSSRLELSGPGGGPITTRQLTPEAADLIRRRILYGEDDED